MNTTSLNGIVLAFGGTVVAGLGFLVLASLGGSMCCTDPRDIAAGAFYLATAGSALLTVGVWRTGVWKEGIVADGTGFVISIGLTVLALGFFASSIPPVPSTTSAGIGYFFGLLGSALLMGGMVKMRVGEKRVSPARLDDKVVGRVEREAPGVRSFLIVAGLGVITTIVSGWLVTVNIVTPGGGGVYWGFPFYWKSIQTWLGTFEGFRYNWFSFIMDALVYTSIEYFFLCFLWLNCTARLKGLLAKYLESGRSIAFLAVMAVALFVGSLVYDYAYLWNLWG